jgi:hypothetical protein
VAIVLHRPALQRDDWRSATRALSSIPGPLIVVTNPSFERLPIELYQPVVHPLPAGGMSVRELVFLGFARLPLDFHPPTGSPEWRSGESSTLRSPGIGQRYRAR